MSARVLLVPRPELDLVDVYVLRRNGDQRFAFTIDHGWQPVAPGCEMHRLARVPAIDAAGAVEMADLDRALEPVRRALRADAL